MSKRLFDLSKLDILKQPETEDYVNRKLVVRFKTNEDLVKFSNKIGINLTKHTEFVWLPSGLTKDYKNSYNGKTRLLNINTEKLESEKRKDQYLWYNMPDFDFSNRECYATITFYIDKEYYSPNQLEDIFEQHINESDTMSIWYPYICKNMKRNDIFLGGENPQYPVYIISKGRYDYCLTSKHLSLMCIPHYVVVEPDEVEKYKAKLNLDYATVLELDMDYKNNYDTCDDLGDTVGKGSGGARNFCWDHAYKNGYKWHWLMDDNISGFHRMYNYSTSRAQTGAIFRCCEDFVNRFNNIYIAGLQYKMFAFATEYRPPYTLNTRIYSCLLIKCDIPYRWRCRYNEDTDLSLRVLKDGHCTCLFNAFLADKVVTQRIPGGNTDTIYTIGTMMKSKVLEDLHPDVAKVIWKYGRWHHVVNYQPFRDIDPQLKPEFKNISKENNNYGMYMAYIDDWTEKNRLYRYELEDKYKKM